MALSKESIRVYAADERPIVLAGMRAVVQAPDSGMQLTGEATSGHTLLWMLQTRFDCDVVVTDFSMQGTDPCAGDGLRLLGQLRTHFPGIGVAVFTEVRNPPLLRAMLELGVHAIVDKSGALDELPAAIRCAASGRRYLSRAIQRLLDAATGCGRGAPLSRQEAEVVRLFASGKSVSEIALSFSRSVKTVSRQKSDAMRKLGLENHSQLYAYALSGGLTR
ncbi:response regulator [Luteimonas sp. S4-F44]|uniref:response regulator n=1 Tax=Luteimonas sp. S4-F44 TaxID=2925842 RepID=UPI001F536E47|nr:response regulator [Luteimonas sp. S4-F44]UNK43118.1 response regulator [Luteimonas sp. S4-F44]